MACPFEEARQSRRAVGRARDALSQAIRQATTPDSGLTTSYRDGGVSTQRYAAATDDGTDYVIRRRKELAVAIERRDKINKEGIALAGSALLWEAML